MILKELFFYARLIERRLPGLGDKVAVVYGVGFFYSFADCGHCRSLTRKSSGGYAVL